MNRKRSILESNWTYYFCTGGVWWLSTLVMPLIYFELLWTHSSFHTLPAPAPSFFVGRVRSIPSRGQTLGHPCFAAYQLDTHLRGACLSGRDFRLCDDSHVLLGQAHRPAWPRHLMRPCLLENYLRHNSPSTQRSTISRRSLIAPPEMAKPVDRAISLLLFSRSLSPCSASTCGGLGGRDISAVARP